MYRSSLDSKDLWANKHILYYNPTPTVKKCNSIAPGVILIVLLLGIFSIILTAAFRIICRPCKPVFGSPNSKTLQKTSCCRIEQWTSFSLDSIDKFRFFCKFHKSCNSLLFCCSNLILEG